MSAIPSGVVFAVMAKSTATTSDKEPVNVRLAGELLDRARDFIKKQPVKPTMTALIEAALQEWLDRHNPKPPKGK